MQSVRVFARPSFLLPASGAAAYPGEGEGVYEDEKGRKYPGTYLPWFKRKGLVQVKAGKSGKMISAHGSSEAKAVARWAL